MSSDTKYIEKSFKRMFTNPGSYSGFYTLVAIAGFVVTLAGWGLYKIVKGIIYMIQKNKEEEAKRIERQKYLDMLSAIISFTDYEISYEYIKSKLNQDTADTEQFVNFLAFDERNRSIININTLLNNALGGILEVATKRGDTENCIKLHNAEIYSLSSLLKEMLHQDVTFRKV